jgi:hypothetical protein
MSKKDVLTVTKDGKTIELNLEQGRFFSAGTLYKELNVKSFDPGLANSAIVPSNICEIDGAEG